MREENEITNKICAWYYLNDCPNRQQVRSGELKLPEGVNQDLIEAWLPTLNRIRKEDFALDFGTKKDKNEKTIVVASDFHIPFLDKEAFAVFLNFLYDFQPDELVLMVILTIVPLSHPIQRLESWEMRSKLVRKKNNIGSQ